MCSPGIRRLTVTPRSCSRRFVLSWMSSEFDNLTVLGGIPGYVIATGRTFLFSDIWRKKSEASRSPIGAWH